MTAIGNVPLVTSAWLPHQATVTHTLPTPLPHRLPHLATVTATQEATQATLNDAAASGAAGSGGQVAGGGEGGGGSSGVTLRNAGRAHEAMTRMTNHRLSKDMATLSTMSTMSNVVVSLGEWVPVGQEDMQRLLYRLQSAAPSVATTTVVVNLSRQEIKRREEAEAAMQSAAHAAQSAIKADAERKEAAAMERAKYGGAWSDDEDCDALGPEAQAAVDKAAAVSVLVSP